MYRKPYSAKVHSTCKSVLMFLNKGVTAGEVGFSLIYAHKWGKCYFIEVIDFAIRINIKSSTSACLLWVGIEWERASSISVQFPMRPNTWGFLCYGNWELEGQDRILWAVLVLPPFAFLFFLILVLQWTVCYSDLWVSS